MISLQILSIVLISPFWPATLAKFNKDAVAPEASHFQETSFAAFIRTGKANWLPLIASALKADALIFTSPEPAHPIYSFTATADLIEASAFIAAVAHGNSLFFSASARIVSAVFPPTAVTTATAVLQTSFFIRYIFTASADSIPPKS